MPQLQYSLIGEASQFRQSMRSAADASEMLDVSLNELRSAVANLTEGNVQLRNEQGQFVSTLKEAANASELFEAALSELNSEGVQTTQQVREQIDRLEQLEQIYGEDALAAKGLREEQQRLERQLAEVGESTAHQVQDLSRLDQEFEQATVAMTDFGSRQDRLQAELRATAATQERVASTGVTMRSSVSASANNLAFEMTQAAQDAQFGLAGVANQIPLMSEQFTQLTDKTGSTSGAIRTLTSTFMGPVGLLAAGTLLLQMGPQIVDFFTSTAKAAEEANEAYKSAAESFFSLQDIEFEGEATAEGLRRQQDRLRSAIERLRAQESRLAAGVTSPEQRRRRAEINNRLERYNALLQEVNSQLRERRSEIQLTLDAQGNLLRQVEEVQAKDRLIEFEMPDFQKFGSFFEEADLQGFVARLDEARTKADELAESFDDIGQQVVGEDGYTSGIEEATFRQERFNEALQNSLDRMERMSDMRAQMRAFGIPQQAAQGQRIEPASQQSVQEGQIQANQLVGAAGSFQRLLERNPQLQRFNNLLSLTNKEIRELAKNTQKVGVIAERSMERGFLRLNDIANLTKQEFQDLARTITGDVNTSIAEFMLTTRQGLTLTAQTMQRSFGNMAQAFQDLQRAGEEHSQALFIAWKASAIGQAVAATFLAANRALAQLPPPIGEAVAATRIAAGLANVARIAKAEPGQSATGGGGGQRAFIPSPDVNSGATGRSPRGVSPNQAQIRGGQQMEITGELRGEGEELIAVVDTVRNRRQR